MFFRAASYGAAAMHQTAPGRFRRRRAALLAALTVTLYGPGGKRGTVYDPVSVVTEWASGFQTERAAALFLFRNGFTPVLPFTGSL